MDGSPEGWECVECCPVAALNRQGGPSKSPKPYEYNGKKSGGFTNGDIGQGIGHNREFGDSGGPSRFFQCFPPQEESMNLFTRTDTRAEVFEGDCLDRLREMEDESVHAVVTDPPYGLSKEPDVAEVMRHWLAGDDYLHNSKGFMGKSWDSFVPGPCYWKEVYRVMKPGAHLLCFSGTRTWDLMSMALRFAGFENRDTISHEGPPAMRWYQGSGFPKGKNVATELEKMGEHEAAERFAGFNVALKPAWEVILCFRKPLSEKSIAKNVLEHSTGALNIGATRVNSKPRTTHKDGNIQGTAPQPMDWGKQTKHTVAGAEGRWPANLLLSHHESCQRVGEKRIKGAGWRDKDTAPSVGDVYGDDKRNRTGPHYADPDGKETVAAYECHESCPCRILDEQSGERPNGYRSNPSTNKTTWFGATDGRHIEGERGYKDEGGASRFFAQFHPDTGPGFKYQSKASKRDRTSNGAVENTHPTAKPTALLQYLARLVCVPGGTVLDPFLGSGSTAVACLREGLNCIGIEQDAEYAATARARIEAEREVLSRKESSRLDGRQDRPAYDKTSTVQADSLFD